MNLGLCVLCRRVVPLEADVCRACKVITTGNEYLTASHARAILVDGPGGGLPPSLVSRTRERVQTMRPGIRYLVLVHEVDEDGSTGDIVEGEVAQNLGERLGLGEPSDPDGFAIYYVEA